MLRDMTADFSSAPEVVDQGRTQAEKEAAEFQRERQRYEEENMQRLTLTKAQKKKLNAARLGKHCLFVVTASRRSGINGGQH